MDQTGNWICSHWELERKDMDKPQFETTGLSPELVSISDWLYIHHCTRASDKPELVHTFYPLRVRSLGYRVPCKVRYNMGIYRDENGLGYRCVDDGKTKPDAELTYTEPIICPGRYRKTRYQYGWWEKWTKAKGWERVG